LAKELLQLIQTVRRRAVSLAWMRAVCFALASITLIACLVLLLDFWLRPESSLSRLLWLVLFLFGSCLVFVKSILPAVHYWPDPIQMARRIESTEPDWHDQLATSVQIASEQTGAARQPELSQIQSQLIKQSCQRLRQQPATQALNSRSVVGPVLFLIAMAALGGLFFAAQKPEVLYGLKRIALPWSAADWPRYNQLVLEVPIPTEVAKGANISIQVRDANQRLSQSQIHIESAKGNRMIKLMPDANDPARFNTVIQNVQESLRLRISGGDDQTPWHAVNVVDIPNVESLDLAWSHPQIDEGESHPANENFRCWPGSVIRIRGTVDMPLNTATLLIRSGDHEQAFNLDVDSNGLQFTGPADAPLADHLTAKGFIQLTSRENVLSPEYPVFEYRMLQDQPPKVTIAANDQVAGLRSKIGLQIQIQDEQPIEQARMTLFRNSDSAESRLVDRKLENDAGRPTDSDIVFSDTQTIDLAAIPDLKEGDRLQISVDTADRNGNRAEIQPATVEVVSPDRLVAIANQRADQLARVLGELQTQQFVLNARTESARQPQIQTRTLNQILNTQRRNSSLFGQGDRSVMHLGNQLISFIDRHQVAWGGTRNARLARQLFTEIENESLPQLLLQLDQIDQQVGLFPKADQHSIDLTQLVRWQNEFIGKVGQAERLLNDSITFEQLVDTSQKLLDQQIEMTGDTRQLQSMTIANPNNRLVTDFEQLINRQARLRSESEQFMRQLDQVTRQTTSDDDGIQSRLAAALQVAGTGQLLPTLFQAESRLVERQPGQSLAAQQEAVKVLQQIVDSLAANSEGDFAGSQDLTQKIGEITTRLTQLTEQLQPFIESEQQMPSEERQRIDEAKQALEQEMAELKQAVDASPFDGLDPMIQKAIDRVRESSNSRKVAELNLESADLQQAVRQLQNAAMEIANQKQADESDSTDLKKLLAFLTEIETAQQSINRWTIRKRQALDNTSGNVRATIELQQKVAAGIEALGQSLKQYPTVDILTTSITKAVNTSLERLSEFVFDDSTLKAQQDAVSGMQQLRTAIEIQLAANQNTTEVESEGGNEQEQSAAQGISSFELTMLYVLQQAIQDETQQLAKDRSKAGDETESLRQRRVALSQRQRRISQVLDQLLNKKTESIPDLPDFSP